MIGGGPVAERKVAGLILSGARIKVISPDFTEQLSVWGKQGKISLAQRPYQYGDLQGTTLAFTATNRSEINQAVSKEAEKEGIWLNVADQSSPGNFIVPASFSEKDIAVAVSSHGKNPALAAKVRNRIRDFLNQPLSSQDR